MGGMVKRSNASRGTRAEPVATRTLVATRGRLSADEAMALLLGLMLGRLDDIETRLDRIEAIKSSRQDRPNGRL